MLKASQVPLNARVDLSFCEVDVKRNLLRIFLDVPAVLRSVKESLRIFLEPTLMDTNSRAKRTPKS